MASFTVAQQGSGIDVSEVRDKIQAKNGLDLIWESRLIFAEILFCFRECHDLCVESGLFGHDVILKVDQCAVDFRRLSLDSVSVAKRVSNQWLDTALATFENIESEKNPKAMLELLGKQAKELSRCFKVFAAWARDLALRFHKAQDGTIKEAEEFKKYFAKAYEDAQAECERLQSEFQRASEIREKSDEAKSSLTSQRMQVTFNPVKYFVSRVGSSMADSRSVEANRLEREANDALREAKENLQQKTTDNKKAKVLYIIANLRSMIILINCIIISL